MTPEIRPRMSFEELIDDAIEANARDVPGRQLTYACLEDCKAAMAFIRGKRVTIEMGS
jgi:hypothetical protein